jgi:sugar lactone lactonase YvrE
MMKRHTGASLVALISLLPFGIVRAASTGAAVQLGHVRVIENGLTVQQPHHKATKGRVKAPLYAQYGLRTGKKERASIGFVDGSVLHMNQVTDAELRDPHVTVVRSGEVDQVDTPGSNHQVKTAAAVASAIGTNFDVRVVKKQSVFIVDFGRVTVHNRKGSVTLHRNQETTVAPNQPPTPPQSVDADGLIGWTDGLSGWQVVGQQFADPAAVTADAQGNVYVADTLNNRVVKLNRSGKQVLTWNGRGASGGTMLQPNGIVADGSGHVYVNVGHDVIDKYSSDGVFEAEFGKLDFSSSNPGEFFGAAGLAVDSAGNLYVADRGNGRIQKLSPTGQPLGIFDDQGGAGIEEPFAVAVDRDGNVYAADSIFGTIIKMSPAGTQLRVIGAKGSEPGQMDGVQGLAVDASGDIFVSDTFNARIQELSATGEPIAVWGSGDSQNHSAGQFFEPAGLYLDGHGVLYVADEGNKRVQRLVGAGT